MDFSRFTSMGFLIAALVLAQTISHIVRVLVYWPTMKALAKSESGDGYAVSTWAYWSFHSYLTVLYLSVVSHDYWLAGLFFISGLCTTWVAVIAYAKQRKKKREEQVPPS